MNSFERFNINHLSPSSLNLWRSAPGLWAMRYLGKVSDKGGAAMWRGSAVENGFAAYLRGGDPHEAALRSYELNCAGEITDEIDAERELIAPMLDQCLKWQPPGPLNAAQIKVEYFFDPVPIPVIGYLDFSFENLMNSTAPRIDIDLKSIKACPSSPRPDHIRQVSLYRAARGRAGGLLYVTNKKHAYFEINDEDMEIGLESLRADMLSLNNFLARCETKEDALRSLPVDWDHWQAPKTKVPLADILMAG